MVAVDVGAAPKKLKLTALNPKVTCPGLVAVKVAVEIELGGNRTEQVKVDVETSGLEDVFRDLVAEQFPGFSFVAPAGKQPWAGAVGQTGMIVPKVEVQEPCRLRGQGKLNSLIVFDFFGRNDDVHHTILARTGPLDVAFDVEVDEIARSHGRHKKYLDGEGAFNRHGISAQPAVMMQNLFDSPGREIEKQSDVLRVIELAEAVPVLGRHSLGLGFNFFAEVAECL